MPDRRVRRAWCACVAVIAVTLASSGCSKSKSAPTAPTSGTDWVQAAGPEGASIASLAVHRSMLFAGTVDGIVRRKAANAPWEESGLEGNNVLALADAGGLIYAGTEVAGLYGSDDDGGSWTRMGAGTIVTVKAILVSAGIVYAGTPDGVYRSVDYGAHWLLVNAGLPAEHDVRSLATDGTTLFAGLRGSAGVYRSTDGGITWTAAGGGFGPFQDVFALLVRRGIVYAGCYTNVYRSVNGGASWSIALAGGETDSWTSLAGDSIAVYAGVNFDGDGVPPAAGVFRSTDDGVTWDTANQGIPHLQVNALVASGGTVWAGCEGDGVFQSVDHALHWTDANKHLVKTYVGDVYHDGTALFAATSNSVLRSTDDGGNWESADAGLERGAHSICGGTPYLFAATHDDAFRSADGGASWQPMLPGYVDELALSGDTLYAVTAGAMQRSRTAGADWEPVATGIANVLAIGFAKGVMYAAGAGFAASFDNGASWSPFATGLGADAIVGIASDSTAVFAATSAGEVFRLSNALDVWQPANVGLPSGGAIRLLGSDGVVYAATADGVYRTTDGARWSRDGAALAGVSVVSLGSRGGMLYAGTRSAGMWKRPN